MMITAEMPVGMRPGRPCRRPAIVLCHLMGWLCAPFFMYHMHRVHMVHMVHVMDVVLHIDRHRSRHGNFHRNLYNMRYDRHILFLILACPACMDTAPFLFFQRPLRMPLVETIFTVERLRLIASTM